MDKCVHRTLMFARSGIIVRATRGMILQQILAAPFAVKRCKVWHSSGFVDTCKLKTIDAVVPAVGQNGQRPAAFGKGRTDGPFD